MEPVDGNVVTNSNVILTSSYYPGTLESVVTTSIAGFAKSAGNKSN